LVESCVEPVVSVFKLRLLSDYEIDTVLFPLHEAVFGESVASVVPQVEVHGFFEGVRLARVVSEDSEFGLAGHGLVTFPNCGRRSYLVSCLAVQAHRLHGDFSGKVHVRWVKSHCHKPSCPICFKVWAYREARAMAEVLESAELVFHRSVEHLMVSLNDAESKLPFKLQYKLVVKRAEARGWLGGSIIPHPYRFRRGAGFFVRWHWHFLGFVEDTYSMCRCCSKACFRMVKTGGGKIVRQLVDSKPCMSCGGFEGLTRRLNKGFVESDGCKVKGDGTVVKLLAERQSVEATCRYELSHCGYPLAGKRRNVVHWQGCLSYRSFKHPKVVKRRVLCPTCGLPLQKVRYVGNSHVTKLGDGFDEFDLPLFEDGSGSPCLVPVVSRFNWDDG
jgi:hypothetical protein